MENHLTRPELGNPAFSNPMPGTLTLQLRKPTSLFVFPHYINMILTNFDMTKERKKLANLFVAIIPRKTSSGKQC